MISCENRAELGKVTTERVQVVMICSTAIMFASCQELKYYLFGGEPKVGAPTS